MIRLQKLTLIRGTKPLLEAADLALNPGEKIGLIGANGSGKSSLFALLRGELHADGGDADFPASWRISHVAQETPALDRPALEYAIDGDSTLRRLEASLVEAEAAHDGHKIGELHAALHDADAYTVRARAEQLLNGLGFSRDQMNRPVASFSGGWRMRLNLAQALMCPSDLLLLDEPTNHLDLDAILWLEDWLKRYAGTLIIISHDRDFLDGVVNVIVHIDERKLKRYGGNYSSFEKQRAINLALCPRLPTLLPTKSTKASNLVWKPASAVCSSTTKDSTGIPCSLLRPGRIPLATISGMQDRGRMWMMPSRFCLAKATLRAMLSKPWPPMKPRR